MSTRCTINFCTDDGELVAKIYRHCDGYPDGEHGVPADLARFFADVQQQCSNDTRFNDPAYLAAKYVVWQAARNARSAKAPLNFLSLGVTVSDPPDIAYTYQVTASHGHALPAVTFHEARDRFAPEVL